MIAAHEAAAGHALSEPSVTMGLSVNLGYPSFRRYSRIRERDRQDDANTIGYLESVAMSYTHNAIFLIELILHKVIKF